MKRNYWPLLFISIFSFTFGMIVWTISSAVKVPVNEDEAFLKSYHELDRGFNDVISSNTKFLDKYNFNIKINKNDFGLVLSDMFLSQRVMEEKSKHKNTFINGKNSITILIKDKKSGKKIDNAELLFRISRPTNHNNTMDFKNEDFKIVNNGYILDLELPLKGNWNATGSFKVGDDTGYFYIKSNAI
ncbi:MAG: hypothetical protein C0625_16540 [Arcobacter sp.]|nr:MAG: hypothetical protein C0625_16540 [Arcobacter sp.]